MSRHWRPISSRLWRGEAVLLLVLSGQTGWAEAADLDAHPLVVIARALEAQGSHTQAITEYKRYLFFAAGDGFESEVYYRIGLLLRRDGRTDDALQAFSRAATAASDRALRLRCDLARAATLIATGRTTEAEVLLLTLRASSSQEDDDRRIAYYALLCAMSANRWADALTELSRAYPSGGTGVAALGVALEEAARGKRWSERTAQWLSVFVPGAGQVYAGEVWDGLNAFAVNGLSAAVVVVLAMDRHWGEAALVLLYLFNRFYFGNIENARTAARERSEREGRLVLSRLGSIMAEVPPPSH